MKKQISPANAMTAVVFGICLIALFIVTVMLYQVDIDRRLAHLAIDELESQLQQEQQAHQEDIIKYSSVVAELNTQVAVLQEENIALNRQIQVLEGCIEELPDEVINLSEADKEALLKVAMSEAGNQGVIGKALVMRVVLNRVAHPTKYADDAESVILSGAFNVTAPGGGYWTCVPDWECKVALYLVTHGWDESNGVLYFTSVGYSPYGDDDIAFQYKDHYFN